MDITGLWVESFVIMVIHTKCFHITLRIQVSPGHFFLLDVLSSVYLILNVCIFHSSRLRSVTDTLFQRGSRVVNPRDVPITIFVKIVHFISHVIIFLLNFI